MENVQSRLLRDRISNLPDNVKELILIRLPTRDAVRTSILSRNWRHEWAKLPQLVLDYTVWENVSELHPDEIMLTKIVNHFLLRHDGPVKKFVLSDHRVKSCPEIDNLIYFLSKSHIEDLRLEMYWDEDRYLLPYSFFSCEKLKRLRLGFCTIRSFPAASKGFSRLTSLKLFDVTISDESLSSLILGSPLLNELEIRIYSEVNICIDAPNLRTFTAYGEMKSIEFKRVPILAFVSITSYSIVDFGSAKKIIVKFFDCLGSLNSLQLNFNLVQSFAAKIQRRLPTSFIHFKTLKLIGISFNVMVDLSFTLCLLRSSPILKYIEIVLFENTINCNSDKTTTYMEVEDFSDICLSELREVKLDYFSGTKPELEFIRLLLAKSPSLHKIQIKLKKSDVDNGFEILKEVTKFRRISKDAEIIFTE